MNELPNDESASLFPNIEFVETYPETSIEANFEVPQQVIQSSLEDATPMERSDTSVPAVVTYEVIKDGLQKGKEKLADSEGYTYTVKAKRANGNRVWTCSVRNKSMWCKASVLEKAGSFTQGSQPHIHSAQLGAATAARISTAVKKIAATEIFTSAAEIVNKVLLINAMFSLCLKMQCIFSFFVANEEASPSIVHTFF